MTSFFRIESADDLPKAVEFASGEGGGAKFRWYVARMAKAYGKSDLVPGDWNVDTSSAAFRVRSADDLQQNSKVDQAVDALAAKTLPGLQRSVKWGLSYYGVGDGCCFSFGGFAGHVKLMFINGAALHPVPPVTPVGMGKATRGVELKSLGDLNERQIAAWMKEVTSVPGVGGKKV